MIRMWLIDHAALLASIAGDRVSRPFTRLEAWCQFVWWNDYSPEQRRAYQQRFYPDEP